MVVLWIFVGALVGWGGGRTLVLNGRHGVAGDVVAGVAGSVLAALALQLQQGQPTDALVVALAGLGGALVATFVRRAYADRFRRSPA
jgi:uncharacterized membrane protein YeaQ/YmgE (transglycosylase-associated protein family)